MREGQMVAQFTLLARCRRFGNTSSEFRVSLTTLVQHTIALMILGRSVATEWSILKHPLTIKLIQSQSSVSPIEKAAR